MCSNPIITLDDDTPIDAIKVEDYPMGDNNSFDNSDVVEEVTPIAKNANRRTHVILNKSMEKPKSFLSNNTSQRFISLLPIFCVVGMVGSPLSKSRNMLLHVVMDTTLMSIL